jgi:hypothetical protein
VDATRVKAGRDLYKKMCSRCHQVIDRTDLDKRLKAKMTKVADVNTDPQMLENFRDKFLGKVTTGILKGQPKILPLPTFGDEAQGQEILINVTIGTLLGGGALRIKGVGAPAPTGVEVPQALEVEDKRVNAAFRQTIEDMQSKKDRYKARPLVGVWATAPFLHNGSVPTLADLLKPDTCKDASKPAACRPTTFYVGSTEFDLENVGFSTSPSTGAVPFDTALTGNSNRGHSGPKYGTELSEGDKRNLLEYLKVVGEPVAGKP